MLIMYQPAINEWEIKQRKTDFVCRSIMKTLGNGDGLTANVKILKAILSTPWRHLGSIFYTKRFRATNHSIVGGGGGV